MEIKLFKIIKKTFKILVKNIAVAFIKTKTVLNLLLSSFDMCL